MLELPAPKSLAPYISVVRQSLKSAGRDYEQLVTKTRPGRRVNGRRDSVYSLTDEGKRILAEAEAARNAALDSYLGALSGDDLAALTAALPPLHKLVERAQRGQPTGQPPAGRPEGSAAGAKGRRQRPA